MNHRPIGLFDSGIGGLTVLQEVASILQQEDFVYFGDTKRFPYGNLPKETIVRFATENTAFLLSKEIKLLVIACYTACSHAYETLQKQLSIPVIGIVDAAVEEIIQTTKTNSVAILGTTSTIESGSLQAKLLAKKPDLEIHSIACPLFAFFVEEGLKDHPLLYQIATHYLANLRKTKVDCALLACTHYPLITSPIQAAVGADISLITPGKSCAKKILDVLRKNQMQNQNKHPTYRFFVSANEKKFRRHAQNFLTLPIKELELATSCAK